MLDAPAQHHQPLAPPAVVAPASREVSFGLVAGRAPAGTRRIVVHIGGRVAADRPLRGRSFSLHVPVAGSTSVRVTAVDGRNRRSSTDVPLVLGLPRAASPRNATPRLDYALARQLHSVRRSHGGTHGIYVQDLRTGRGAAWNAGARFPAASALKLAIAVTALRRLDGPPASASRITALLGRMLIVSDNDAANELETWIGGSVYAGSDRVDETMRALGLHDTLMYGGYESSRRPAAAVPSIPIRVDSQPAFGLGKYSTAADLARLGRALYLAAAGKGPLLRLGVSGSEARHLLWVLAQVPDRGKLGRFLGRGATLFHKAGWIPAARHDNGIVVTAAGAFVAAVMTWQSGSADVLAGEVARTAREHFGG
jgi:beta-lactamase class A